MVQDVVVPESLKMPVPGHDYPRTWTQFLDWFPDEAACREYLEDIRWRDGFVCSSCGALGEAFRGSRERWICRHCRHQSSVTAGTIFDKTRIPLRSWLAAVWYITNQKQGVNALGLQRVLGLGSYQTAWALLHRLRRAMIRPGRDRLHGTVEVDETFVGRSAANSSRDKKKLKTSSSQALRNQSVVAIAIEIKPKMGFGRVRMRHLTDKSARSLTPFVLDSVRLRSALRTDGSAAYRFLSRHGYRLDQHVLLGAEQPAHATLPGVHRVASLLKRWLLGTHQGAVSSKQLDYYLDEFTFRFNRRTSRSRGLLFYRLLEQAVVTEPVTYTEMTDNAKHNI